LIILKDIIKTYNAKNQQVEALKGVSLYIKAGEIFGIIGYSGAGKSTLIRCINLLEKPSSGTVILNNRELTALSPKELRKSREKIGMIFQHFNLMRSRDVFHNIAYPLKGKGLSRGEIEKKVSSLLELVGLSDKSSAYPSQLSGGQKQRVAIARALANDPQVLLCDEATSALDPKTTQSILKLLKDINRKLNLTIVVITHEMQVVKEICSRVAVMEGGLIVEEGELLEVFANPKTQAAKGFTATVFQFNRVYDLLEREQFINAISDDEVLSRISFTGKITGEAFISKISRLFKIDASILFGNIEIIQNVPVGNLIVKFGGNSDNIKHAIEYLEEHNIPVEVIKYDRGSDSSYTQCNQSVS